MPLKVYIYIFCILRVFFAHSPIIYESYLHISIWPIDGILTDTTTSGQSGTGSNGNEGGLYSKLRKKKKTKQKNRILTWGDWKSIFTILQK